MPTTSNGSTSGVIPTLTVLGPLAQAVDPHLLATAAWCFRRQTGSCLNRVLVKAVNGALRLNTALLGEIWVGAGWRTGDAIVGMMEIQVTPELRIGYARDFTLSEIRDYSSGSNELLIGFDFGQGITAKRSPRYF